MIMRDDDMIDRRQIIELNSWRLEPFSGNRNRRGMIRENRVNQNHLAINGQ